MAMRETHLDETVRLQPRENCKAQPKSKSVPKSDQDCCTLARDRPVTVDNISQGDGCSGAEDSVCDAHSRNRNHGMKMVAQTDAPHQQSNGAKDKDWYETPQAILGLEITLSSLGDKGHGPVASGTAGNATD